MSYLLRVRATWRANRWCKWVAADNAQRCLQRSNNNFEQTSIKWHNSGWFRANITGFGCGFDKCKIDDTLLHSSISTFGHAFIELCHNSLMEILKQALDTDTRVKNWTEWKAAWYFKEVHVRQDTGWSYHWRWKIWMYFFIANNGLSWSWCISKKQEEYRTQQ